MDKEMTFWEHLGELRVRLIRAFLYLVIAAILGWYTYPVVDRVLVAPSVQLFKMHGIKLMYLTFTGPFFLRFQVAMIVGAVYALPLMTLEMWGFVAPALLPRERKWVYLVAPLSICFFLLGVLAGYLVMQPAISWFLGYLPSGQSIMQNVPDYILFECKCVIAFGLVFQLPVVLMFLAIVGVVNAKMLKGYWRHAVCILTVVAAVVTPSNDPVTMLAMAVPLVVLYGLSIFLVGFVERMAGRKPRPVLHHDDDPLRTG